MAKRNRRWLRSSPKKPEPKIPEALKAELTEKANVLIETKLKPWKLDLDKASKEKGFNYVVDVYTTWWRIYFYFCSKYRCPGPNAITEYSRHGLHG